MSLNVGWWRLNACSYDSRGLDGSLKPTLSSMKRTSDVFL